MAITGDDVKRIWADVKENRRKLDSCKLHQFQVGTVELGKTMTCINCGGSILPSHVGMYIEGYVAAGGRADMIWPAWRMHKRGK